MDRRPQRSPSLAERTAGRTSTGPAAARASVPPTAPSPTRTAPPAPTAAPAPPAPPAPPVQRHCWVVDGVTPDVRAPGLLVEWRQLGGAWQGRVAYVVGADDEATLVEAWLPASQLVRASPR
ncbi:hypothetical protein [Aquipuribacter sp. MA13-6]|uniref:hypothetical protein n=1 Tax=unclassified Aquipuribacter TaxID=2635084 RepID=UPI003EEB3324